MPRDQGFGSEVRSGLEARRSWLVEQHLATTDGDMVRYRPDLFSQLQRRELLRVAAGIARDTGLGFTEAREGHFEGVLRRRLDLASGRFALIDNGREFALVPWRPTLERAIGRSIAGRARGDGGIDWTIGPGRQMEV